jgi:hypothetical protein
MAGIDRARIAEKLYKQLEKKGLLKEIKILRSDLNAYKERADNLYVCTIKAYFHREEARVEAESVEAATINKLYNNKLLVCYNDESLKIKQDDYFTLEGKKYKIIDTGNVENIILDMYLQRM